MAHHGRTLNQLPVHGAVALCASFNMHKSSVQLERPFSVKKVIINRYLAVI